MARPNRGNEAVRRPFARPDDVRTVYELASNRRAWADSSEAERLAFLALLSQGFPAAYGATVVVGGTTIPFDWWQYPLGSKCDMTGEPVRDGFWGHNPDVASSLPWTGTDDNPERSGWYFDPEAWYHTQFTVLSVRSSNFCNYIYTEGMASADRNTLFLDTENNRCIVCLPYSGPENAFRWAFLRAPQACPPASPEAQRFGVMFPVPLLVPTGRLYLYSQNATVGSHLIWRLFGRWRFDPRFLPDVIPANE